MALPKEGKKHFRIKFEKHIEVDCSDGQVVDLIETHTALSRQQIKQAMIKGAGWITRDRHTQRARRVDKN